METNADLQVYDLAHLGLVAGIMDRMKLVETVDHQVGPRPNEKVSTGVALKAALLNALGFVSSPLYLFSHFFQGKPTELLLGPGSPPSSSTTTTGRPLRGRGHRGLPGDCPGGPKGLPLCTWTPPASTSTGCTGAGKKARRSMRGMNPGPSASPTAIPAITARTSSGG